MSYNTILKGPNKTIHKNHTLKPRTNIDAHANTIKFIMNIRLRKPHIQLLGLTKQIISVK